MMSNDDPIPSPDGTGSTDENAARADAPPAPEQDEPYPKRNKKLVTAGLAFGIGSAAIAAALLFAGRSKPRGEGN